MIERQLTQALADLRDVQKQRADLDPYVINLRPIPRCSERDSLDQTTFDAWSDLRKDEEKLSKLIEEFCLQRRRQS